MPTKRRKLEILSQDKATKMVKNSQNILIPRIRKWKWPPIIPTVRLHHQKFHL